MKAKLESILKNKYALIVILAGLVLLLLSPLGSDKDEDVSTIPNELSMPEFSLEKEETRLQSQLSLIKGAGKVSVLLAVEGSASRELAESGEETLVISGGGTEKVVELFFMNPQYLGAVIVCEGAGNSLVQLEITQAVKAFTGLGSDRIRIIQMRG